MSRTYNRERLSFVMGVFDQRHLTGQTVEVMLAMNDLLEYMDEIDAAAFTRGAQAHEAQAVRTMTANDSGSYMGTIPS